MPTHAGHQVGDPKASILAGQEGFLVRRRYFVGPHVDFDPPWSGRTAGEP